MENIITAVSNLIKEIIVYNNEVKEKKQESNNNLKN